MKIIKCLGTENSFRRDVYARMRRRRNSFARDTFFQAAVILKKVVRMFVQVLQRRGEGKKEEGIPSNGRFL